MAAFNTKNPFEKLHGDVLNTEPSSEEEKAKLVAEIKERGNCFPKLEEWRKQICCIAVLLN